jgi:hypothetical protein
VWVSLDLPLAAINDAGFQAMTQKVMSSLSPVAVLANLGIGYKTFPEPYAPVEKFKGELQPAPWPLALLPEVLWKPLGLSPMLDKKSGRQVLGAPVKAVTAMADISPAMMELFKMFPQAGAFVEKEKAPWRVLSYFTGVRLTPTNRAEEAYYYNVEKMNKMKEAAKLIAQKGGRLSEEEWKELLR